MSQSILDKEGLTYYSSQIKGLINARADATLSNVEAADFRTKDNEANIITTAGTGAAYTATVPGITALTAGVGFIMVPHTVSTSQTPTLNVNSLGAKNLRRRISNSTVTTTYGSSANWIGANKPVYVFYDGTYWIVDFPRPNANDIYGTVAVSLGGTGKTTVTADSFLVGAGTDAMIEKTPAEVLAHIGAAPAGYGYGGTIPDLIEVTSDDALKTALDNLLSEMPEFSARNVRIIHSGSQTVNGIQGMAGQGTLYGSLYKHTNSYAILRVFGYLGYAFSLVKTSTWGEVGWDNPPMASGVEYRTTKRHNSNPVYTKLIDFGTLPNATSSNIDIGVEYDKITDIKGIATSSSGAVTNIFPKGNSSGGIDAYVYAAYPEKLWVVAKTNLSAYTAKFVVEYVK